ncbi:MAG TPA: RibD family protein [Vicinamibacterales bacterium]
MKQTTSQTAQTAAEAWSIVLAAARGAQRIADSGEPVALTLVDNGVLQPINPGHPDAMIAWCAATGWRTVLPSDDPRTAMIDLYLPFCTAQPTVVGHLGQSLDGFIATHSGESQYVTGEENILHLHRMRALSDAVVVGAGTVAADDPRLTTRLVPGPNPLRVVLDPARRLGDHFRVFTDAAADTLYVCAQSLAQPGEDRFGRATVVALDGDEDTVDVSELLRVLRARGCRRIFVEGGGVTVSMFLEAKRLDRLQIAIAPLLIGDGRPAIRLTPPSALSDCHRPRYRVFRMGSDVLFDCEIGPALQDEPGDSRDEQPAITRVI